jgi:GIY-YIG catalytic domain
MLWEKKVSPSRWAPIEEMIREFQKHLAPKVPQLQIEKGVDCAEPYPARKAVSQSLNKQGVYLIFDDSESKIYIGATIERPLADRCQEHIKNKQSKQGKRFKDLGFTPRWIDVIPFDGEWAFFAPSLELYLIDKVARKEHGCTLASVNKRGGNAAMIFALLAILAEE